MNVGATVDGVTAPDGAVPVVVVVPEPPAGITITEVEGVEVVVSSGGGGGGGAGGSVVVVVVVVSVWLSENWPIAV